MKLIKLVLEIDGKVVREVKFRDNLNIITSKKNVDTAGNSVGKSTLGRILDYLFDGSISPIYIDEEFQTPNSQIESLFKNKIVYVILEYIGLTNISSTIKRRLSPKTELQDYYLDAKEVTKKEYISHIMKTIFNVSSEKPTIRKLAPKFLGLTLIGCYILLNLIMEEIFLNLILVQYFYIFLISVIQKYLQKGLN